MTNCKALFYIISFVLLMTGCLNNSNNKAETPGSLNRLIVLAPGHFHAALLQKKMYPQIDSSVYVYAPDGEELKAYTNLIEQYNTREKEPTNWKENIYANNDFLEKMLLEKKGDIVIIASNNKNKTDYITQSIQAGLNVLADKPMAISQEGFEKLKEAFNTAKEKKILLYDIMTSRYDITNIILKELSQIPSIFGELEKGSIEEPSVISESVHHFYKQVSGKPLVRPSWFFDVKQQGEGIVDITTHLLDLIQWTCFSEQLLDYNKDIIINSAKRWATVITPTQFARVTNQTSYPAYLNNDIKDSLLNVYANGEINYSIKNIHSKVSVVWNYEAREGGGDTYYSLLRGSKCNLSIKQSKEQLYKPVIYIDPNQSNNTDEWQRLLKEGIQKINDKYPGIAIEKVGESWIVVIPEKYHITHEQQFALVVNKYLEYLAQHNMPEWEISGMLTKYYITTTALKNASDKAIEQYEKTLTECTCDKPLKRP